MITLMIHELSFIFEYCFQTVMLEAKLKREKGKEKAEQQCF